MHSVKRYKLQPRVYTKSYDKYIHSHIWIWEKLDKQEHLKTSQELQTIRMSSFLACSVLCSWSCLPCLVQSQPLLLNVAWPRQIMPSPDCAHFLRLRIVVSTVPPHDLVLSNWANTYKGFETFLYITRAQEISSVTIPPKNKLIAFQRTSKGWSSWSSVIWVCHWVILM